MSEQLEIAYSKLGLKEPFIAAVMTRIKREVSDKVPTAGTDGACVWYNPDFIADLTPAELFGLVLHESLHVVLMHMWRRGSRDMRLWNYANDAIINAYIRSRGYSLPSGGVYVDWVKDDMDSEYVYRQLKKEEEEEGEEKFDSGGFDGEGDITDAPDDATKADLESTIAASAQMATTHTVDHPDALSAKVFTCRVCIAKHWEVYYSVSILLGLCRRKNYHK